MTEDKSPKDHVPPEPRRDEFSEDRKGIIVMPVDSAPAIDIVNVAPTGLPAPQEAPPPEK
ncbi:MAG: hypothetical protein WKF96_05575 [Solirubrobacteraceae bacterium]